MSGEFYDSSAFVKLFVDERGSEQMTRRFALATPRIVSRLAFLETASAIRRLQFEGSLSVIEAETARSFVQKAVEEVSIVPLTNSQLVLAEELLNTHRLRSLDALQLAAALTTASLIEVFVTSDVRLTRAAIAEGLRVIDPTAVAEHRAT